MSQCKYTQWFIDKRVLVSGKESILNTQNPLEIGLLPKGGIYNDVLVKCSEKDFHTRWDTITNVLSLAGFGKVANTIFVMENGDDATGLIEDFNKPFRNIYSAMSVASVGDTVIVYPGTYTHSQGQQLIKSGVNLYLMEGVNVIINNYRTFIPHGFDTIQLGEEGGIYGNGNITINFSALFNSVSYIVSNVSPSSNNITFNLNSLKLYGNQLVFSNFNTLNIDIKNLEVYGKTIGLSIENCFNSKILVNINSYLNINSAANAGIQIKDLINSTVTINVNNVNFTTLSGRTGFLNTNNNDQYSTINVNVYNLICVNATTQVNAKAPLYMSNLCSAYKNINFYSFQTTGTLYLPQTYNANTLEKGQVTFNGTIIDKVLLPFNPVIVQDIIICRKFLQAISFNLNVYDESVSTVGALIEKGIINITSPNGFQKIKGYFNTVKEPSSNSPVCMISSESSVSTPKNATLDNFTCVGTNGLISIKNVATAVFTAEIPIKDVYTNVAPDLTNVVLHLDTLIIDTTYVV